MSLYIQKGRLRDAIVRLSDWRGKVQSQTANHVFPYLALREKGVNSSTLARYEETDDYAFFDKYLKVRESGQRPYFDPLNRKFRIATHPHSNVATSRKNTFENRWGAAKSELRPDGQTYWILSPESATILSEHAMTRAGVTQRANVIDLSVWLFRHDEFPDDADSQTLLQRFKTAFPMSDQEFDQLFEYLPETSGHIFGDQAISRDEALEIVKALDTEAAPIVTQASAPAPGSKETSSKSLLDEDDPILAEVCGLIELGSSGVILRGAPGTSKSWYAWNIALKLTNDSPDRIYRIQFHPSYGYEDFVEGYMPDEGSRSGFKVDPRIFLKAVDTATNTNGPIVFIIDEINRGDTSRIFGELLTYIEHGWRDVPFNVKLSGSPISIPRNLIVLATMNPHDRSITQLDMALQRRFDHIDISPSREKATEFMTQAGMSVHDANLVSAWFESLQRMLPFGIGHAYFLNVGDVGRLGLVWRYRILPFCENILEFEPDRIETIRRSFEGLERRLRGLEGE